MLKPRARRAPRAPAWGLLLSVTIATTVGGYAWNERGASGAQIYYVDATGGRDDASGISPEMAWQTLAKASSHALRSGDAILLKRGERWQEGLEIAARLMADTNGTVTVGAYGTGDPPVIGALTVRRDNTIVENLTVDQRRHGRRLFSLDGQFDGDLVDQRKVSSRLRDAFASRGVTLSPDAIIREDLPPADWTLSDPARKREYGLHVERDRIDVLQAEDAVRVLRARNCELKNLTLRNGIRDGIDADRADDLLIDGCLIHHFLAGSFDEQHDAHGIVITRTRGVTVRNTEVHHVSGDCFQSDPSRSDPITNDILIENCHFWTSPLAEDFNRGWSAGDRPGENAIDTKSVKDWKSGERMRLDVRNVRAHGWQKDSFISTKAAFNIKEKVEAVFDGVTVYDCEIAFRLRGTRGNANVTIINGVIYDCDVAIRPEDDLQNLKVYNTTFGTGIGRIFRDAEMHREAGAKRSWELRNNAFARRPDARTDKMALDENADAARLDAKSYVLHLDRSNRAARTADFADLPNHDYHPAENSALIDRGTNLPHVKTDREGTARPQGAAHDVGAYERVRGDASQ